MNDAVPTKKVPLVASAPLSEFGDFDANELLDSRPQGLERDGTYVPGFSEMRVTRDTAVGQYLRGDLARGDIPTLPVNLRWARSQKKNGEPDSSKPFAHSRKGYRFVTKDDLNKDWFKEVPGGSQWDAGGNLRNGDTVLMVADAKSAARNEAIRRRDTEERLTGVSATLSQKMAEAGIRTKGVDPQVKKMASDEKLFNGDKK